MSNKRTLSDLIDLIKFRTGLNQSQIAEQVGYSRTYLSEALSKADPSPKIVSKIKLAFAEELKDGYVKQKDSNVLNDDGGGAKYKKASTIKDVDAFLVTNQIRQEAMLQTIMEFLAEIGGGVLDRSSMTLLGDLNKRVEEKEKELRAELGRTA